MARRPARATKAKSAPAAARWDLADLYPSPSHPSVAQDIESARTQAQRFEKQFAGKLAKLDAAQLLKAVRGYEAQQDRLGRLASYAQLLYASDMADPAVTQFYQNTVEAITAISRHLLFFTLEINTLSEPALKRAYAQSAGLRRYRPWLDAVRSGKPYQLAENLEHYIHETSVTQASWQRLFDETIARLRFSVGKENLGSAEVFDRLSDADGTRRKQAASAIAEVFAREAPLFSLITNTLAKAKQIDDTTRGFAAPISSRNLANQVEDEVVAALIATVRANYRQLSHRYYRWKARQFGKKQLEYWDRNAPLPCESDRTITWPQAKQIVLDAYHAFSPELAAHGKSFFTRPWIDVYPRPGKSPGAFAHPTVPSAHPYLLLNYLGKTRDVMTLAHELGHGVHQVLSAPQGALMADTPLTLAETASVFGEMLTFQSLLAQEKRAAHRQRLIAGKVEDMLNTVVRQIAFCSFEQRVHDARRSGELSVEQINAIWLDVQAESLGPAIRLRPEYGVYWMYIPHFIHTPFYVYAYAFGDCLVNSLYGVYLREQKAGRGPAFAKKYLQMLSAGGTLRHRELLQPFGLDASRADFWQTGLNVIAGYIDQLENPAG